jgi:hypothetical protein
MKSCQLQNSITFQDLQKFILVVWPFVHPT